MKSRLVLQAVGASLLVAVGATNAAEVQQDEPPSAQPTMQQNSNASPRTNADTSYGGVRDTRSESGRTRTRTCDIGPQCDIYFGQ